MENTNKYKNARIYKIVDNTNQQIYIGSTYESLSRRLGHHRSAYKIHLNDSSKVKYVTSFEILKNNDFAIYLIEEYPCENKEQLLRRERHYIETIQCINKMIPIRSNEEKKQYTKSKNKEYYDINKEQIHDRQKEYRNNNKEYFNEYNKEYYDTNKEQIHEQKKEYYQNNKEKIQKYRDDNKDIMKQQQKIYDESRKEKRKEYRKEHYKANKERIQQRKQEKFICDCGSSYSRSSKAKHMKTVKHQTWMNSQSEKQSEPESEQ